jgi:dipeptidase E
MKLLLTSAGIKNQSIEDALVELLGKPIAESSALFIPTAIYPFRGGPHMAWRAISGQTGNRLCELGWKSLGILELSVLPSIERDVWMSTVRETDALLVWGGDPVFLCNWMRTSGLADLLPSLRDTVYVGVSAGSMATTTIIGETYREPPRTGGELLTSETIVFEGDLRRLLVTARGMGLVEFSVIPHLNNAHHPDASLANAEAWAARIPAPTYAIDDDTAIKVTGGAVEVVSEGHWKLLT